VINLFFVVNETFNKLLNHWNHTGCNVLLHPESGPWFIWPILLVTYCQLAHRNWLPQQASYCPYNYWDVISMQRCWESVITSMLKGQTSHSFCFAMNTGFISFNMSIYRAKVINLQKIPVLLHEVLLHDVKIGVWCAMSVNRITGATFFSWPWIHSDKLHTSWCHFLNTP
jgi:hypothetical protein